MEVSISPKLVIFQRTNFSRRLERNRVSWGLWALGAMFTVSFKKRVVRKLRIIILLHFGLVTFRSRYGEDRNPFIVMIFAFLYVPMTPKTNMESVSSRKHEMDLYNFQSKEVKQMQDKFSAKGI